MILSCTVATFQWFVRYIGLYSLVLFGVFFLLVYIFSVKAQRSIPFIFPQFSFFSMLRISHLSKTYPNGVRALQGISLTIPRGMFGLLGPNGAGKSSLMRTIATLQSADEGEIIFDGLNILESEENKALLRKILGYLPQEFGLYPTLSAEAILDHFAVLKGISNTAERKDIVTYLLERVNLFTVRTKRVGGFSGGMKQRLGIAIALLGDPRLIIVDEPTAGLDPTERHRFLNLLAELGEEIIVILSTHIVEDVRELCSSMAIINQGKVALAGTPEEVIAKVQGKVWRKDILSSEADYFNQQYHVISSRLIGGKPQIHILADTQPDGSWKPVEANLEDVYFATIAGAHASV